MFYVPAVVKERKIFKIVLNSPILIYFRNSTYCLKIEITAKFVQPEPNLCYSAETIFTQRLPVAGDGQLVCPYLDYFKDDYNKYPKIQWYKVILYKVCWFTFPANKIAFWSKQ